MKVFWLIYLVFMAVVFSSFRQEYDMKEMRETLRVASDSKENSAKLLIRLAIMPEKTQC